MSTSEVTLPIPTAGLQPPVRRKPRLHGLDWLRAGAILLVVALHSGIAYLVAPMPGLVWSTREPVGSLAVDAICWWTNAFIMPLFFVLSGFVAWGLMQRTGPAEFLKHRTQRVLGPLLLGCVLILPLDLYVWLLGWAAEDRIPLRKLQSLKIEGPLADGLWGVSHLWFLQYLWLFCTGAAAIRWFGERRRRDHLTCAGEEQSAGADIHQLRPQLYSVLRTRYADDVIVGLLGVSSFALWWEPQLVIGFRHSWWPLPANLLFYAPWFAIGWLMAARQPRRRMPRGEWRLLASLGVFAALWPLIHQHVASELQGQARILLATLFVLHAWLAVSGWLGLCLRWLDRTPPPAVKYIASASFWIYLLHHPVVGLTQVSLRPLAVSPIVKFALTLTMGVALPLLTYEAFVRRTWIGVMLNGRSVPPVPQPVVVPDESQEAEPMRRAA